MKRIYIDSFQAAPTVTRNTTYADLKRDVLAAGRFSVFEATENNFAASLYTRLCEDPEIETDKSCGFPWTSVRLKEAGRNG